MASAALKDSDDCTDLVPNPNHQTPLEQDASEDPEVIQFYETTGPFGCFSNFSRHPISIDGKRWPTSEHYFQAQKFSGTYHEEEIRGLEKASEAAQAGRDRSRPLRRDWEDVKDDVMYKALMAKFTQHIDIARTLLRTGDAVLVEHTKNDSYWADGGNGKGKNMLGVLLMRVRKELQNRPECKQVVAEVEAEFAKLEEEEEENEVGVRARKQAPKTRRKKLRARVNVYVDKDGSSKLESANDGKGTVNVVGAEGITLNKKALPAAAQMAVLQNQYRRRGKPEEDDFWEEEADEENEGESEYIRSKSRPANKLGNYLNAPTSSNNKEGGAPLDASQSISSVVTSTKVTAELITSLLANKAAAAQVTPLAEELRVKRDALAEALSSEQTEKDMEAILAAVELANEVLAKSQC